MKKLVAMALVALAGCASIEDIRGYQPKAERTVQVEWRDLANCMTDRVMRREQVVPVLRERERTARLSSFSGAGWGPHVPIGEIEIEATGMATSVIRFRARPNIMGTTYFDQDLAACSPQA